MARKKVPHTFVIVFSIIVIAAIATWFVQGGEYTRTVKVLPDGTQKSIIIPGSFKAVDNHPQTWQVFSALFEGFVNKADIIVFILIIGGAFWILNESKAIDISILAFLNFTKRLEHNVLIKKAGVNNIVIVLIMIMFSTFGSVFGMAEETIAFVAIFVPLSIRMGYDSIVGICLCFFAAGLGFAGATLNPFTIGIAQGLSNIPLFSGLEYRIFCWFVITALGIAFVLYYASRIRKNPGKSPVFEEDQTWRDQASEPVTTVAFKTPVSGWVVFGLLLATMVVFSVKYSISTMAFGKSELVFPVIPVLTLLFAFTGLFTLRKSIHFFILSLFVFTIFYLIVGVMGYQWYVMEIATLFFVMGISSGIAMSYSANQIATLFISGVKDIVSAALVVGLAGGIIIVLQNGNVIDPMLHSLADSMRNMGRFGSLSIMYGIQTLINVIITSGSAKAALTMPIMAPFSDLIHVSRQATVMAYQLGDGFTNLLTPTSATLIGVLGVARIPYEKWLKWAWPMILVLIIVGLLLLIPTVTMTLNGF
jgi:uncharacterized ion transporter superfamily protein YfcC